MLAPSTFQGSHVSSDTGSTPHSSTGCMHALPSTAVRQSGTFQEATSFSRAPGQQLPHGRRGELPSIQGYKSEVPSRRFYKVQESSAVATKRNGGRRDSVAAAAQLQKQSVERSSWLKGSGALL